MARYRVTIGDREIEVEVEGSTVRAGDATLRASEDRGAVLLELLDDGERTERVPFEPAPDPARSVAILPEGLVEMRVESERDRLAGSLRSAHARGGRRELRSAIPGVIRVIHKGAGDRVEPGDTIVVLEAMKMANEVRADDRGVVVEIAVAPGERVAAGALLAVIDADGE